MERLWCLLIACFILGCGGNSTGPEPTPQYPEPEPKPLPEPKQESGHQRKELNYENLRGWWWGGGMYIFRADNSVKITGFYYEFSGEYYVKDPYIAMRGRETRGVTRRYTFDEVFFWKGTITKIKTDTLHTLYPASLGRDTLRTPYPEWITVETRTETILTLRVMHIYEKYLQEILNLPDPSSATIMSLSSDKFSSILDSLQKDNVADQPHLLGHSFQLWRD